MKFNSSYPRRFTSLPSNGTLSIMWRHFSLAVSLAVAGASLPSAHASDVYWDIDGATTAGAGSATPTGNWTTSAMNWSPDSTGASATAAWVNGDNAVFSAGTNATGAFVVTSGILTVGNITQEEGRIQIKPSAAANVLNLAAATNTFSTNTRVSDDYDIRLDSKIGNQADGTPAAIVKEGPGALLFVNSGSTFSGGITLNAGTLSVQSDNPLGAGPVTLNGGNFVRNYATVTLANPINVTGNTTVTSIISTGAFNLTGTWQAGSTSGNFNVANATVNGYAPISGTTIQITGDISAYTGKISHTNGNTRLRMGATAAGAITLDGSKAKFFTAGPTGTGNPLDLADDTYGTWKMGELSGTGGAVNAGWATAGNTNFEIGALNTDSTYSGKLGDIPRGSNGYASVTKVGTGTLTFNGPNSYGKATLVSSGTLVAASATALGSTATGTTVSSGATLDLRADIGAEAISISGSGVGGNGALITSTGSATAAGAVALTGNASVGGNGNLTLNGVVSGGFGLTKVGSGTTTLSQAATYSGATQISGGKLVLTAPNGSLNPLSNITVTSGGLDALGTLGNITVAAGAGNSISNSSGNALVTGDLTFGGAATLNLTTSSTTPVITVNALTTTSTGIVVNVTNSSWTTGTYPLISYGSYTGSLPHFTKGTIANLGARQSASLTNKDSAINLVISGDTPYWTGAANANWTTSVIASPKNWKLQNALTSTDFQTNDSVIFDDNKVGSSTVNIAANVSPIITTFNNVNYDYTLTSTGGFGIITGSLVKNSSGKLTLANANTYPGGTLLADGVTEINNPSAIGTGPLTFSGGASIDNTSGSPLTLTTNNPLVWNTDLYFVGTNPLNLGTGASALAQDRTVVVQASELTLGGVISGTAKLTKYGEGTLTLTAANTYSGGTSVGEGSLHGTTTSIQGSVANNSNVIFDQATNGTYSGVMSGSGVLTKINSNTLTLTGKNTVSNVTVDAGILALGSGGSTGTLGGVINVNTGGTVNLTVADSMGYSSTASVKTVNINGGTMNNAVAGNNGFYTNFVLTGGTLGQTLFPGNLNGINFSAGFGVTSLASANPSTISARLVCRNGVNLTFSVEDGAAANDLVISSVITENNAEGKGGGSVTKTGPGTMVLSGNNAYTGTTTVTGGVLAVTGNALPDTTKLTLDGGTVSATGTEVVATLYFGTTQQAAGTWGATGSGATHIDDTHFSGTGVISVTTGPSGYASWATTNGLTAGVNDGATQDPDGDGIPNLLEYVLGGLPIGTGAANTAILPAQALDAANLVITFRRSDLSEADTTQTVQISTDLVTWTNFATAGAATAAPVTVTEDSPTADLDTVSVAIPRTHEAAGKLYARLNVIKN